MISLVIGTILIFIIMGIPAGFAIMLCWNWFLVPLGVMEITFWHAVGLDLLITLFLIPPIYPDFDMEAEWREALKFLWGRIKSCWIMCTLAITLGWVIQQFLMHNIG